MRELVDAYAHCADRRGCEGQMALFTEATRFLVFMAAKASTPNQTVMRRADLRPVFEDLRRYEATTHFNGQSTVVLNGAVATGESNRMAHHLLVQDGRSGQMVASLRYLDPFTQQAGRWLFGERRLLVDWIETRPL